MLLQMLGVQQLTGLNGLLLVLISIEGSNTLLGGAVLFVCQTGLLQRIQIPVPGQQQGSAVTDLQIVGSDGHPGSPELIHFIQQILAIKRNAITQNVHNTLTENAGGEQVQSKGPLVIYDRVTGVAAALITDHDVIVIGEIIYHAALALVAPVDTYDCTVCHVACLLKFLRSSSAVHSFFDRIIIKCFFRQEK